MKKFLFGLAIMFFVTNPCFAIKIGLVCNEKTSYIASSSPAVLVDGRTKNSILKIKEMCRYDIKVSKNNIAIRMDDGKYYNTRTNHLILVSQNGFVSTKNRWYRGNLIIKSNNYLTVINDIGLEDYLLGVLPAEMPSSWSKEALKAQAIAARSYTLANIGKRSYLGFDLKDNQEDQVYLGASHEKVKTSEAVLETKGKVLVCNKKIINAYYCSSAGGQTKLAAEAWPNSPNLPYIHSVYSFDAERAKNGHGVGMSQYGANFLAQKGYNYSQILNYFYSNIALATLK